MDLIALIKQKRQTLFSIFLVFLVVGLLVLLTQDFKYSTKSKILVIQEGAGRVDPYSVSRSVEYLSDLLTRVVYSNSFYESVMESDFNIDKNYFGDTSIKQSKAWKKTVSAKSLEDSGIINISVYHKDNYQATQIALAVNHVLITKHQNFHGLGSSVKINVIDQPIASTYPTKPNLMYALLIIIAGSLFFGLVYIYLFPEKKYDIHLFGHKSRIPKNKNLPPMNRVASTMRNIEENRGAKMPEKEDENNYENVKKSGDIDNLFQ